MGYLPVPVPVPLPVAPDDPELPDMPDVPEVPDVPDMPDVAPVDPPVEPVVAGGALVSFDDVPLNPDVPGDPLVLPVPFDIPVVEPVPDRRAFSRAMHASRSADGTFWQSIVGSSARLAGTRLVVVGAAFMPDVPVVAPLVVP
jgi:hypothetical protein